MSLSFSNQTEFYPVVDFIDIVQPFVCTPYPKFKYSDLAKTLVDSKKKKRIVSALGLWQLK